MDTPHDLTELDDSELDTLRSAVLTEREQRTRRENLPSQLADMVRAAVKAGCDPDALLERVAGALTDEQETTR